MTPCGLVVVLHRQRKPTLKAAAVALSEPWACSSRLHGVTARKTVTFIVADGKVTDCELLWCPCGNVCHNNLCEGCVRHSGAGEDPVVAGYDAVPLDK